MLQHTPPSILFSLHKTPIKVRRCTQECRRFRKRRVCWKRFVHIYDEADVLWILQCLRKLGRQICGQNTFVFILLANLLAIGRHATMPEIV